MDLSKQTTLKPTKDNENLCKTCRGFPCIHITDQKHKFGAYPLVERCTGYKKKY